MSPPAALAVPLTATAAELVGLAARVLDITVTHTNTREQFDRVIGSFQGVKHRLADCYVAIERARSLTYGAAMLVTDPVADAEETWRAAALAKAAASEAAVARDSAISGRNAMARLISVSTEAVTSQTCSSLTMPGW